MPCLLQSPEEQVDVNKPCIRLPGGEDLLHPGVIEGTGKPEPTDEVVPGAHVVGGKDPEAAETAQEDVFG